MKALFSKYSKHLPILFLTAFCLGLLAVTVRITYSRYQNFESGKFDLGNMAQMVWNTGHGRFMYVTDYFGTNMPRWGMSHVDPFLIVFVPVMTFIKSPLVLVFSQLMFVIGTSIILYKIGELELKNKLAALALALAYLFYPAIGYILAWTDFHGVTAVMPFFAGAFYLFEKMHKEGSFTRRRLVWFWVLLVLSMSGKEEISLFVAFLGLFILLFRKGAQVQKKLAIWMMGVGIVWFIFAFFVLIPSAAHYRIEGYERFVESIGVEPDETQNVAKENYFLLRYEEFGHSYAEIIFNMATNPKQVMRAWLDGSKAYYFEQTFLPVLYTPLLYPPIFMIAIPELIINYTSTSGGVSTANIENHRISLIIVVMFISTIYGLSFFSKLFKDYLKIKENWTITALSVAILVMCIHKTFEYGNPVYLWIQQSVQRRILPLVNAEENIIEDSKAFREDLAIGESLKLVRLETQDRDCAQYILGLVPEYASVSGPDYMGAKLSMRETYAIFPALYREADVVIADVYARKVSRVLGLPSIIVNSAMGEVMMSPHYKTKFVCGNLAMFERTSSPQEKSQILPVQEVYSYTPTMDAEIYRGLHLRDFELPNEITRGEFIKAEFVFEKKSNRSLDAHKLFLTFVNVDTAEYFQIPHLASYAIHPLLDWNRERFYTEEVEIMIPEDYAVGTYRVFEGMTDGIETRSVYIGEIELK